MAPVFGLLSCSKDVDRLRGCKYIKAGSSFSENTLGPLKSTLIKKLDIDNAQVSLALSFKKT